MDRFEFLGVLGGRTMLASVFLLSLSCLIALAMHGADRLSIDDRAAKGRAAPWP